MGWKTILGDIAEVKKAIQNNQEMPRQWIINLTKTLQNKAWGIFSIDFPLLEKAWLNKMLQSSTQSPEIKEKAKQRLKTLELQEIEETEGGVKPKAGGFVPAQLISRLF